MSRSLQFEIVAADPAVEEILETVIRAARTGEIGDGRIFVPPVDETYKIRTGERNVL
jgi:nitrogen regulatory protein P-II 1